MMAESHTDKMERFRAILKQRLTEKRFYHCCMVSKEAARLAEKYGADMEKAEFTGLVHDIEKDTPTDEQLRTIEKYSIILNDVEKAAPKLLHAISGAAVLKYEHNVTDADIINAVRYHTTARAGMSLLEKIIYLADYISADRDYEGVDELRQTIYSSLEKGLDEALDYSVGELLQKHAPIHIDTVMARNELILARQSK
jgi:predicted HD superfamily hydrolase involved in NAD metabolism